MTNILVPTDLTLQSLDIVEEIVRNQHRPVKIYMVHMVHAPSDISDLMFVKRTDLMRQVPLEFSRAMFKLKEQYPQQLSALELRMQYGSNSSVFNSITDNLAIDEICILQDHNYALPLKDSVNIFPMINKSEIPVYKIERKSSRLKAREPRVLIPGTVASFV